MMKGLHLTGSFLVVRESADMVVTAVASLALFALVFASGKALFWCQVLRAAYEQLARCGSHLQVTRVHDECTRCRASVSCVLNRT